MFDQRVWSDYRNPDAFGKLSFPGYMHTVVGILVMLTSFVTGMYTFNDHEGYGRVELVENLVREQPQHAFSGSSNIPDTNIISLSFLNSTRRKTRKISGW